MGEFTFLLLVAARDFSLALLVVSCVVVLIVARIPAMASQLAFYFARQPESIGSLPHRIAQGATGALMWLLILELFRYRVIWDLAALAASAPPLSWIS